MVIEMLSRGDTAQFTGKTKFGGKQTTVLKISEIESFVSNAEDNGVKMVRHYVLTKAGNVYPIAEDQYYELMEYWQHEF
jgi:hypothetical protein